MESTRETRSPSAQAEIEMGFPDTFEDQPLRDFGKAAESFKKVSSSYSTQEPDFEEAGEKWYTALLCFCVLLRLLRIARFNGFCDSSRYCGHNFEPVQTRFSTITAVITAMRKLFQGASIDEVLKSAFIYRGKQGYAYGCGKAMVERFWFRSAGHFSDESILPLSHFFETTKSLPQHVGGPDDDDDELFDPRNIEVSPLRLELSSHDDDCNVAFRTGRPRYSTTNAAAEYGYLQNSRSLLFVFDKISSCGCSKAEAQQLGYLLHDQRHTISHQPPSCWVQRAYGMVQRRLRIMYHDSSKCMNCNQEIQSCGSLRNLFLPTFSLETAIPGLVLRSCAEYAFTPQELGLLVKSKRGSINVRGEYSAAPAGYAPPWVPVDISVKKRMVGNPAKNFPLGKSHADGFYYE